MALTKGIAREYLKEGDGPSIKLPLGIAAQVYEGSCLSYNAGAAGFVRAAAASDTFAGFAEEDELGGAAGGDKFVKAKTRGVVKLAITGVTGHSNAGATVYASDDGTFTLTASTNVPIGKVLRWVSGTTCYVNFESVPVRSL